MFGVHSWLGRVYADGSGTGSGDGTGSGSGNPNPPPSGDGKETPKVFTQEEVNKFLADDRRKHQEKVTALNAELNKFQGTAKEKEALLAKIGELQNGLVTKEELAKQEQEKIRTKYEDDLKKATSEKDQWHRLFVDTVADRAIAEAAAHNRAFNPDQLKLLLKSQVEVKQKTDDKGNFLNEFDVLMPVTVSDKDGTTKVLQLGVKDGVAKMRENPNFANLFLVDGTPGTGTVTINNGGPTSSDGSTPPSDPAAYRAWREKQKKSGRI
jgi:hypothetical protein